MSEKETIRFSSHFRELDIKGKEDSKLKEILSHYDGSLVQIRDHHHNPEDSYMMGKLKIDYHDQESYHLLTLKRENGSGVLVPLQLGYRI